MSDVVHRTLRFHPSFGRGRRDSLIREMHALCPCVFFGVESMGGPCCMVDEQGAVHGPDHGQQRSFIRRVSDLNGLRPLHQIVGKRPGQERPKGPTFGLQDEGFWRKHGRFQRPHEGGEVRGGEGLNLLPCSLVPTLNGGRQQTCFVPHWLPFQRVAHWPT